MVRKFCDSPVNTLRDPASIVAKRITWINGIHVQDDSQLTITTLRYIAEKLSEGRFD